MSFFVKSPLPLRLGLSGLPEGFLLAEGGRYPASGDEEEIGESVEELDDFRVHDLLSAQADHITFGTAADAAGQMQLGGEGSAARENELLERWQLGLEAVNPLLQICNFGGPGWFPALNRAVRLHPCAEIVNSTALPELAADIYTHRTRTIMRYGYFDDEQREYVIERPDVPVSWTNYLGVRDLCTVISHNAGGYTFHKSAEHNRLTRFRPNGVPLDRPGHYVYLRDDDSGDYWSISWQPVGKNLDQAQYEVRHGLSYSRFKCDYADIHAEQLLFIPVDDDVELWDVVIENRGPTPRRLSVFNYLEFSFQHVEIDNQNFQMSLYASGSNYADGVIEFDFFYEPWTYHFLTPHIRGCSTVGGHRRVREGAGAPRFYTMAFPMVGGPDCRVH